ncbi:MAG: SPOR domain-containing protein [Gammaproteobacteria bacterium]|nr:SPOR domain-containing protein [Gammaproteobacteria bacterium]
MADYAKKGKPRAPANKKNTRRGKATPPPAPASRTGLWVMLVLVLLAIAGFSYFLFAIGGKADQVQAPVAPTANPKPSPKPAALPQAPQQKWQYIERLKDKEVVVDVPKKIISNQQFRLQCASYKSLGQADGLKAKIAFQGFESHIKKVQGSSSDWYQVYLGPFKTRRNAEAARHRMQRARINGCQIYFWQG